MPDKIIPGPPPPETPKVPTLTEQAVVLIRRSIFRGRYKPGDQMSEGELVMDLEEAGLSGSRTVVRPALQILAGERLVELVPKKRAKVCRLNTDEIRNILAMSLVLETLVARALAEKKEKKDKSLRRLDELQLGMKALIGTEDLDEIVSFVDLDVDFHCALAEEAGYLEASLAIRRLRNLTRPNTPVTRSTAERRRDVCEEHESILEAVTAGDLKRVEEAVRAHLVNRAQRWLPTDYAEGLQSLDIFQHSRPAGPSCDRLDEPGSTRTSPPPDASGRKRKNR